jgi:hypothetical protein
VDVDGAFEERVGLIGEHEGAEDLHEFTSFGSEDGGTENVVVGGIDDELHETGGFAALDGAGDVGHGTFSDFQLEAFGAGFFFGEADAAELRIGKNTVGYEAVFCGQMLAFDEIAVDDLKIVVGDMREGGAAFAIAEGPEAGDIGFEAGIYVDKAALVGFNAGFVKIEVGGVRTAAGGDQEMGTGDVRGTAGGFEREGDAAVFVFDAGGAGVEEKLDAFGFESFLELGSNFGIFAGNDLRASVENGDAAPEAAKHLSEFKADVAAAENEQVIGNGSELHDGLVGEIRDIFEAGNRWNVWVAAGVDEDFFTFEEIIANLELMRGQKTCGCTIEAEAGALIHLLLLAGAKAENDFVFLGDDFGEIDGYVRGIDAPTLGVARVISNLRAVDHCFGRCAADIDTSAAEIFFFDEGYGPAQIGEAMGERIAGLAGADDDSVVLHGDLRWISAPKQYIGYSECG